MSQPYPSILGPLNQLGPGGPIAQSEWQSFLQHRNVLYQQMLGDLLGAQHLQMQVPGLSDLPALQISQQQNMAANPQAQILSGLAPDLSPLDDSHWSHLIGAARFHGIENPESMAPAQLQAAINAARNYMVQRREEEPKSIWQEAYDTLSTAVGTIGLNAVQGWIDAWSKAPALIREPALAAVGIRPELFDRPDIRQRLEGVPFIGKAIYDTLNQRQYEEGLAQLAEGFTADMTRGERSAYERVALPLSRAFGWGGGMGVVGELVGATPFVGGVGNPVLRASLQGGIGTYYAAGRTDTQTPGEVFRNIRYGLEGGALIGALEPYMPFIQAGWRRLFDKLGSSFPSSLGADADLEWTRAGFNPQGRQFFVGEDITTPAETPGTALVPYHGGEVVEGSITGIPPGAAGPPSLHGSPAPPAFILNPAIRQTPAGFGVAEVPAGYTRFTAPEGGFIPAPVEAPPTVSVSAEASETAFNGRRLLPTSPLFTTKVVDEAGQPLRVYHGTPFSYTEMIPGGGLDGEGYYFTTSSVVAGSTELVGDDPAYAFRSVPEGAEYRPQVRPAYLAITNPWNQNAVLDAAQVGSLLEAAEREFPSFDWNRVRGNLHFYYPSGQVPAEKLYANLSEAVPLRYEDWPEPTFGSRVNEILKVVGYDGIVRRGGTVQGAGGIEHTHWIAFSPSQIFTGVGGLTPYDALADAAALSKQVTIAESPAAPAFAKVGALDDGDVAIAAIQKNPGHISVIRNVGDVGRAVRKFLQEALPNGVGPQDFRVVPHPVTGSSDILVADGTPITNKMVEQYKAHGMFDGMQAVATGAEAEIVRIGSEYSVLRRTDGTGKYFSVHTTEILPGNTAAPVLELGDAYLEAKSYVLSRMADEAIRAGLPLRTVDWFSDELATQLPRYIEEWLDLKGIEGAAARAVYTKAFTDQRVADFRTLAPEEFEAAEALNAQARSALVERQELGYSPTLAEVAEWRGLKWTPLGAGGRLSHSDGVGAFVDLDSEEAAFEYLRAYNPDLPDLSPATTVPAELLLTSGPHAGSSEAPDTWLDTHEGSDALEYTLQDLERLLEDSRKFTGGSGFATPAIPVGVPAFGGRGGMMPPPPPPPTGAAGGFQPPALPPGVPSTGEQFGALENSAFNRYARLQRSFDELIHRWLTPMRGYADWVQRQLHEAGIQVDYFGQIEGVQNSIAAAHNELYGWNRQLAESFWALPRRYIRNGRVVDLLLAPDGDLPQMMQSLDFSPRNQRALLQLRRTWDEFGRAYGVRDLLFHLRSLPRGATPRFTPTTAAERWVTEMLDAGGLDPNELNAEVLTHKLFRAAIFSRDVGPQVDALRREWVTDQRIPQSLREVTSNWLGLVMNGYVPNTPILERGIAGTLNSVFEAAHVPIAFTARDVSRGLGFLSSNLYRSWLGGRAATVFRESINPLMAYSRMGHAQVLGEVFSEFLRNPAAREEMVQRGLEGGWMMRHAYTAHYNETSALDYSPTFPEPQNQFTVGQQQVREAGARALDIGHDVTGRLLTRGFAGSAVDPLIGVDLINENGRLVGGEFGYRLATRGIEAYQASVGADPAADAVVHTTRFLQESGGWNLSHPFQRQIHQLLMGGRIEEARTFFANEVANQMGRFGNSDMAPELQKLGSIGRWGMQLGNFTMQYQYNMRQGIAAGGLAPEFADGLEAVERLNYSRARSGAQFLARHSIIAGAMTLAGATLGVNFTKWYWHNALAWGGGPAAVSIVLQGMRYSAWFKRNISGERTTPLEDELLREKTNAPSILPALMTPYLGAQQSAEQISRGLASEHPFQNTGAFLLTGYHNDPSFTRYYNSDQHYNPATGTIDLPPELQQYVQPSSPLFPAGGGAGQ